MLKQYLLVSDLDDTLLGDDRALAEFREFVEEAGERLTLVYATGRFYPTVVDDIERTDLPPPAMIVGGVGSEMRTYPSGEFNAAWRRQMSQGWSASTVLEVLRSDARLTPQPAEDQSEFKASFYCSDASEADMRRWRQLLAAAGVQTSIVYSSNRDLDFLPAGVDKGRAAAFAADQLGFSNAQVIVSGNSGNDARMFEHDFSGIVVANADEVLKGYSERNHVYLAQRSHALGVVEGLQYWMQ